MRDQLTIVIRTYNRYERLLRLLQYYELCNFPAKFRILDSSNPQALPAPLQTILKSEHIDYYKYPPSIGPAEKLCHGIRREKISTPYCVVSPDDDFITWVGIKTCIDFLERHPDYSSAQGRYVVFHVEDCVAKGITPYHFYGRDIDINSHSPGERIVGQFSHYVPQFHSVHRTETWQAHSEIVQSARITRQGIVNLSEILLSYVTMIFGKYKVLPVFYCAREVIESSAGRTALEIEDIVTDPEYAKEYARFLELLTSLLSGVGELEEEEAKAQIQEGIHVLLDRFLPAYRKGILRQAPASYEELKGESGYPFLDDKEATDEWRKIEYFIRKSLSKDRANELNKVGERKFRKGDRKAAFQAFKEAVEADPGFAMAYNNLGVLTLESGEKEKALAYFAKALKIDPDEQSIILNVIEILRRFGRDDDARETCVSYLGRNPKDEEVASVLSSMDIAQSRVSPKSLSIDEAYK